MVSHTDKQYEKELSALKEMILKMGGLVETMVSESMDALVRRDSNVAREVMLRDSAVDELEMRIDDHCYGLLALRQPAASDLRFIITGLKVSTDLERMGDLAVNICERTIELNKMVPLKPYTDLPKMAELTEAMVKKALDSLVNQDVDLAYSVCEMDDAVDLCNRQIFDELIRLMKADPSAVERGTSILTVSRQLERIADHATNIGEEVIFMVKGRDIRHQVKKESL